MLEYLGVNGRVLTCVIDEAHCIPEYGGDFRQAYSKLRVLRALLLGNCHVPITAFSATVTSRAHDDIKSVLLFEWDATYYINCGNDRPI